MLKIGITGGIGSGKTTICRVFEALAVPVFNADEVAKMIMITDPNLVENIKLHFGKEAYFENGELNRKFLSAIVFNDSKALQQLNKLVHPAVFHAFDNWAVKQNSPYCLHEAAILFESGAYKSCDYSILVFAPEELRIQRVQKRDGHSIAEIRDRMDKQMHEGEKEKLADFIIINDESIAVIPQILKIHNRFSK
jgi:dephospho-CoA kinase